MHDCRSSFQVWLHGVNSYEVKGGGASWQF